MPDIKRKQHTLLDFPQPKGAGIGLFIACISLTL